VDKEGALSFIDSETYNAIENSELPLKVETEDSVPIDRKSCRPLSYSKAQEQLNRLTQGLPLQDFEVP